MTNEAKLKQIISQLLSVDDDEITPGSKIHDDLGADSLDAIELVMEVEGAFDLEIPDECAEKFFTVQDVLDYINAKRPSVAK